MNLFHLRPGFTVINGVVDFTGTLGVTVFPPIAALLGVAEKQNN